MQRVGYDADTERYTFSDANGNLYYSEPGSRYGELTRAGERRPSPRETEARSRAVSRNHSDSVRMMLPFALLVFVFLLLLFVLVNRSGGSGMTWADRGHMQALDCHQDGHQVQVKKGDTCWAIAKEYSLGIEELLGREGNKKINCDKLNVGQGICVPN
ncbi:hypothetical protein GQ44DRAFT_712731 [Phaeosphaeriaceae sp. PMI808]|nr:hypothetical protein GQ44DRAFT_712731 [Phaeosphaeriaceae sp. PMI808]